MLQSSCADEFFSQGNFEDTPDSKCDQQVSQSWLGIPKLSSEELVSASGAAITAPVDYWDVKEELSRYVEYLGCC